MTDYSRIMRNQGNLPAEAAQALGALPQATPKIDVDDTADVTGGGTTAVTGFQLKDQNGQLIKRAVKCGFGVFDDVNGVTPSVAATLDTATAGSIIAGAASNALTVLTDANGKFTCTLTNATDETNTLMGTQPTTGAPPLECEDREDVTFSA
jgi:hypothetical protein